MLAPIMLKLVLSLGLGLLVGLQREWQPRGLVGIRSFALVTLFGTLCGLLVESVGPWVAPAGVLALAALLVLEQWTRLRREEQPGPTSEIAALVMFAVGMTIVYRTDVAIVAGGVVAVLLHWKKPLHAFAQRIDETEIRSIIRLALIGLIILPLLPDRSFASFEVLNPFEIWLMVVLIVGISLAGYLAHKFLGENVGTYLAGVLGGLISSTATTVAYARRSRRGAASTRASALVIHMASIIVFFRVFLEVGVVAKDTLLSIAPPLAAMTAWMAVVLAVCVLLRPARKGQIVQPKDPSNLWAAIVFGLLYAVVLAGVAVAKRHYGDSGLYAVSIVSGLTDMDAITLSTARMMSTQEVGADTGWRMILIGAMSNLGFKALAVAVLGDRALLAYVAALFGASLAGGGFILWLWPFVPVP